MWEPLSGIFYVNSKKCSIKSELKDILYVIVTMAENVGTIRAETVSYFCGYWENSKSISRVVFRMLFFVIDKIL